MEYLRVGTIIRTIGLRGEVKVYPTTDFRDSRFKSGNRLFLSKDDGDLKEVTIKIHRKNGECDNLIFKEISSIEEAEKYVHYDLLVEKDNKVLRKDEYFYTDLIGCTVIFDNDSLIGEVINVEEYASYRTLRVKRDNGKDVLIPFVDAFIKTVDIESKKIIVKFIEGLLWK